MAPCLIGDPDEEKTRMSNVGENVSDAIQPPKVQTVNTPSVSENPTTGIQDVFRVGVRVPPFWPEEPAVWFAQLEGQFVLSGITSDSTKFYHVIGQLEPQFASEVKDIILSPPDTNKYDKLKTELIRRLSVSQEQKTRQLMLHEELGDRKPTQFLRHLRNLAGPTVPDDFLRPVWCGRLPSNIQTIVASQPKLSLDDVAELADRIQELAPTTRNVASTSYERTTDTTSGLIERVEELAQQVEALLKVDNLRRQGREPTRRYRSESRGASRSKSWQRASFHTVPDGPTICWYHYRFGSNADKCVKPCTFKSGNIQGRQ